MSDSGSGLDLSAMLRQAQELSGKMQQVQAELRHRTVEATVGGGMVTATVNGALEVVSIKIDPRAVDPRDVEMLQDLVVAAVNQAHREASQLVNEEMQRATGLPMQQMQGLFQKPGS
jgi:DNA-binding YbaB/EbfC family protein